MFSNWFTFEKSQPDERKKDICLWSSMWEMFEWEKSISRLMLELYMLYLCFIFEPNFSNFSSVQSLSRVRLFATPWIAECQASLSITNSQSSLKLTSFSFCPQSLPASVSFPMTQLFTWGGQSTGVSASASFPPKKSQGWSPSEWTGLIGAPCSPRDSQESSPTPHFKSINSSVLSFLHSPTLTSIHDHRKNHSLD